MVVLLAKASSATKAARLAASQSKLATWEKHPRDKEKLDDLARVATADGHCRKRNYMRDMSASLKRHGFMLGVPIHLLQDAA